MGSSSPLHASAVLACLTFPLVASAASTEIGPGADISAAIAALGPGDELVLRGGIYALNTRFAVTAVGTSAQPIVIRGKAGETALIDMATPNQNVVEVQGSRYLILRNLHFHGGSHGIRLMESNFVTIEDSEVYETGDVGISANSGGTYEGLIIRRNNIHHTHGTGEGMYLGCNTNACRVINSVIESNHVHHTNGADVEQGDGIELKEGSAGNTIRNNVVHDTNYPGILTYSTVGNGPPNIIEGNVIWRSNDFAIQSAADSIIRNNIVLGTIGLQPHQSGSPANQEVVHNTVVSDGNGIEVRGVTGSVIIANNAVYSETGTAIRLISGNLSLVTLAGNVGVGSISGASSGYANGHGIAADFVAANYNGAPPIDVFPKTGSALIGAAAAQYVTAFDFNGNPRDTADVGAYNFRAGGNPGWMIVADFKASIGTTIPNPPTALVAR